MTLVSLVGNINFEAYTRLNNDYNFAGYPSVFYDGGDTVGVGAPEPPGDEYYYRDRIEAVGARTVPDLDLLIRMDYISGTTYDITVKVGNGVPANSDPAIPTSVVGPINIDVSANASFKAASTDPDLDELYYQYDWGDGTTSSWVGPFNSGDSSSADNTWDQSGNYDIKVRTKDIWNATTDWSPLHTIRVGCCIADRGNVNGDSGDAINVSDLVYLVAYSFQNGSAPPCMDEADVNASGTINVSDLVYLVAYSFQSGAAPLTCP